MSRRLETMFALGTTEIGSGKVMNGGNGGVNGVNDGAGGANGIGGYGPNGGGGAQATPSTLSLDLPTATEFSSFSSGQNSTAAGKMQSTGLGLVHLSTDRQSAVDQLLTSESAAASVVNSTVSLYTTSAFGARPNGAE